MGKGARSKCHDLEPSIFPVRPDLFQSIRILSHDLPSFFSIFKAVRSAMIFLSQLVLSRTALNQRFYFVSLKLSSKKLRTGLYGSYDEDGLNSAHLTTFFF